MQKAVEEADPEGKLQDIAWSSCFVRRPEWRDGRKKGTRKGTRKRPPSQAALIYLCDSLYASKSQTFC